MIADALRYNPPMNEISKMEKICASENRFLRNLDQTKGTGFIYDALLRFYQRAEALESKGER